MRKVLVLLIGLFTVVGVTGCFLDKLFLNVETQEALKEGEESRVALAEAKAKLEAAQTQQEKEAAQLALTRASDRADEAITQLDEALASKTPSMLQSLAGLAGPIAPWALALAGMGTGVWGGIRARKGGVAVREFSEGVEELGETEEGKKLKKKLAKKFEKAGVTSYVDGALRVLGLLRKSNAA